MANIPGATNALPGVFGPTNSAVIKTDKGYAIGWAPISVWKSVFIEGTVKEIAMAAFMEFIKHPKVDPKYAQPEFLHTFSIDFKKTPVCTCRSALYTGSDELEKVDVEAFLKEMNIELERLGKLTPFA